MARRKPQPPVAAPLSPALVYAGGVALFLFIPLVLFLFVRHPAPVGLSLGAGVLLIVGHRLLARPYMAAGGAGQVRVVQPRPARCPGRQTGRGGLHPGAALRRRSRQARCCAVHRQPATKFFTFLHAWRWPLRLGIFVPLLFLLTALAASAAGQPAPVDARHRLVQAGGRRHRQRRGPRLSSSPARQPRSKSPSRSTTSSSSACATCSGSSAWWGSGGSGRGSPTWPSSAISGAIRADYCSSNRRSIYPGGLSRRFVMRLVRL